MKRIAYVERCFKKFTEKEIERGAYFGVKLFEIHAYEGFSKLLHKEYIVKKTISKIVPKYFYLVIVFFRVLFLVPWYLVHIQNGI